MTRFEQDEMRDRLANQAYFTFYKRVLTRRAKESPAYFKAAILLAVDHAPYWVTDETKEKLTRHVIAKLATLG